MDGITLSQKELKTFNMHASSALSALIISNDIGKLFQNTTKEFKDQTMKVLAEQAHGFAFHMMIARNKAEGKI